MKVIWKYELKIADYQVIEIPKGSRLLTVQTQREHPMLWVIVNPEIKETETREIMMAGTGHKKSDRLFLGSYLGTFQILSGDLVFHVFETFMGGKHD